MQGTQYCNNYAHTLTLRLAGVQQFTHAQVADNEPHDGGLVQVGGDIVGQRQLVCELVEHLRLLAPATSGRIPGLLLPALRAHPGKTREELFVHCIYKTLVRPD